MANSVANEIESLKIIYKEVIEGCSYIDETGLYVKHLTEVEHGELARRKALHFKKFKIEGLQTEEDRLKQMLETGEWSKEKEDAIIDTRYLVADNEKNLPKVIPEQQSFIQKIIDEHKKKLKELVDEKDSIMGLTVEGATERESISYYIYLVFYKDSGLTQRTFLAPDDVSEVEDLGYYIRMINESVSRISEDKLRKIAVMPFFLNYFSNCKDSVYNFLCKPIYQLTSNQITLFSFGSRNLNLLSQAEGSPPELIGDVPLQAIVDWYDMQYSIILGRRNAQKKV
jgi:hypothetical protein